MESKHSRSIFNNHLENVSGGQRAIQNREGDGESLYIFHMRQKYDCEAIFNIYLLQYVRAFDWTNSCTHCFVDGILWAAFFLLHKRRLWKNLLSDRATQNINRIIYTFNVKFQKWCVCCIWDKKKNGADAKYRGILTLVHLKLTCQIPIMRKKLIKCERSSRLWMTPLTDEEAAAAARDWISITIIC